MPTLRALTNPGTATWSNGVPTTATSPLAAATVISANDSGGIFTITQPAGVAFAITLPTPAAGQEGLRYIFMLGTAAAASVTVVATGCTFVGTIIDGTPGAAAANNATVTFVGGLAVAGDWIEVVSTSTTTYNIRACSSAVAGITVT